MSGLILTEMVSRVIKAQMRFRLKQAYQTSEKILQQQMQIRCGCDCGVVVVVVVVDVVVAVMVDRYTDFLLSFLLATC